MIYPDRYPLIAVDEGRSMIGVDPRSVRVPDAMTGPAVEISATTAVITISFALLLGLAANLLTRLKTGQKVEGALQSALAAMQEVTKNANEQTKIAQAVNTMQANNAKMVIDAQADRIRDLTDRLISSNEIADKRIAEALNQAELRNSDTIKRLHSRIDRLEQSRDRMAAALTAEDLVPT